ncbi:MAG: hypothetical protein ACJAYB_000901 [Psychromonas sp.]|jgi:uncharacterized protein YejL (UPF0352 family)|uniref:DUF1414 domain-containing protein n=1 Tax=Psychromonas sp. MB-3u-54 TaxID=2058319 RepID=UPI000C325A80|nr:DUF1414 domain-containing protein [Psychromonas sp. MB-3u-54]PKH01492.1 hypothetical protein CXF72_16715 [Psychromonas sp. MB-3u-54]
MPIISKYSNKKIETILDEVMEVLHKNDVSVDLSLMVLGNAITHVINSQVPVNKRAQISEKFVKALSVSINSKEK